MGQAPKLLVTLANSFPTAWFKQACAFRFARYSGLKAAGSAKVVNFVGFYDVVQRGCPNTKIDDSITKIMTF